MMIEHSQLHMKDSGLRSWKKVTAHEVKWKLSTPVKEVYTSLILTAYLAQMKTSLDKCMEMQDERWINTHFIGKKNSYDWE